MKQEPLGGVGGGGHARSTDVLANTRSIDVLANTHPRVECVHTPSRSFFFPGEAGFNSEPVRGLTDVQLTSRRPVTSMGLRGLHEARRPGDAVRDQYEVITSIMGGAKNIRVF